MLLTSEGEGQIAIDSLKTKMGRGNCSRKPLAGNTESTFCREVALRGQRWTVRPRWVKTSGKKPENGGFALGGFIPPRNEKSTSSLSIREDGFGQLEEGNNRQIQKSEDEKKS